MRRGRKAATVVVGGLWLTCEVDMFRLNEIFFSFQVMVILMHEILSKISNEVICFRLSILFCLYFYNDHREKEWSLGNNTSVNLDGDAISSLMSMGRGGRWTVGMGS